MKHADRELPLMRGTLDLLILKALSGGKMHGYGISTWLESCSRGRLSVEDSAIYQALHRLQGRRLVEARWGRSENNRRARYYELTPRGRKDLRAGTETWERYSESVSAILGLDPTVT